jgi:hypothetical protein
MTREPAGERNVGEVDVLAEEHPFGLPKAKLPLIGSHRGPKVTAELFRDVGGVFSSLCRDAFERKILI